MKMLLNIVIIIMMNYYCNSKSIESVSSNTIIDNSLRHLTMAVNNINFINNNYCYFINNIIINFDVIINMNFMIIIVGYTPLMIHDYYYTNPIIFIIY